jgi:hypothetical protein
LESDVTPSLPLSFRSVRTLLAAFIGAGALLTAGCHSNHTDSNYGIGWVTITNETGNFAPTNVHFASYVVTIDSVELTDSVGNTYTVISTAEPIDLTKLTNIAELWGNADIPVDTYVSATVTIDYTNAQISVFVNGVPTPTTVTLAGTTPTAVSLTTVFDPNNPLIVTNSLSTTNAQRLSLDIDLAASNTVDLTTSPITVNANPYLRFANAAPDTKKIRIRGPLINSNTSTGTYSVYERPFYDEADNLGTLSIFNDDATIWNINGAIYTGSTGSQLSGLVQLQTLSAGVTTTQAYTTFQVTPSTQNQQGQPTGTAGIFNALYVVAGGSLETNYTEHITGEVIARTATSTGALLTLTNATIAGDLVGLSQGYFEYINGAAGGTTTNFVDTVQVAIGPATIVSAEGTAGLQNLTYNSIAVGQQISAIGTFDTFNPPSGVITLDAIVQTTGSTAGQVRLLPTNLYGDLQSAATEPLTMNLQTIDEVPASVFDFAGNGATTPTPSAFSVDASTAGTGDFASAAAGTPIFVSGFVPAFGSAPPDFKSFVNLQKAPTPDGVVSGVNLEADVPAVLQVLWSGTGTATPFSTFTASGLTIDLANTALSSAVIQIGPESVSLASLSGTLNVVPNTVSNCVTPVPATSTVQPCLTLYSYGPVTVPASATVATAFNELLEFNTFAGFNTSLKAEISSTELVKTLTAAGYFNRSTNTFTANSVDVVL